MLEVISFIQDTDIPCGAIAEAALVYLGAARLMGVGTHHCLAKKGVWLTDDPSRSGSYVSQ